MPTLRSVRDRLEGNVVLPYALVSLSLPSNRSLPVACFPQRWRADEQLWHFSVLTDRPGPGPAAPAFHAFPCAGITRRWPGFSDDTTLEDVEVAAPVHPSLKEACLDAKRETSPLRVNE